MSYLWGGMILLSVMAAFAGLVTGQTDVLAQVAGASFDYARQSVDIVIGLAGMLCLWSGFFKVAERAGLVELLAARLGGLFRVLMPSVPRNHPALASVTLNISANMLGLDNAATPMGIKAMEQLQSLNKTPETASDAQILFLVLNTSSVTLLPVTIFMYRADLGAAVPTDVFLPILMATGASTLAGLLAVHGFQSLPLFSRQGLKIVWPVLLLVILLVALLAILPLEIRGAFSSGLGNGLVLLVFAVFILMAWKQKIPLYEVFIEGAKEGLVTALNILPYLVAMLVAVGMLRASGILELLVWGVHSLLSLLAGDTRFVDALPVGIMKPFSGSGARALMLETMNAHGVDSFAGRLAAIMQGSTETTFYVLAVYFGAVGIRRVRYAVICGLLADLAGMLMAIFTCYWFFA